MNPHCLTSEPSSEPFDATAFLPGLHANLGDVKELMPRLPISYGENAAARRPACRLLRVCVSPKYMSRRGEDGMQPLRSPQDSWRSVGRGWEGVAYLNW